MIVIKLMNLTVGETADVKSWVKGRFIKNLELLSTKPSGSDGLDMMLLLSWITTKFSADSEDFALLYWDLRPENILVDEHHNLVGYVFPQFSLLVYSIGTTYFLFPFVSRPYPWGTDCFADTRK
jgi:hypothetical protein